MRICSHLLNKSLTENFIFCAVMRQLYHFTNRKSLRLLKIIILLASSHEKSVPLTISHYLYFLCISKVSSMLYHRLLGRVQSKECSFVFTNTFLAFFIVFHHEICVFIILISFFNEISNFRNKILSWNQKLELVIINCQWNCIKSFIQPH